MSLRTIKADLASAPCGTLKWFIAREKPNLDDIEELKKPIEFTEDRLSDVDPNSQIRRIYNSTVRFFSITNEGEVYWFGSAAIISADGLLLTAKHCVEDIKAPNFCIEIPIPPQVKQYFQLDFSLLVPARVVFKYPYIPARVVFKHPYIDLALLKIPEIKDIPYNFTPIAEVDPKESSIVCASGFPRDIKILTVGEVFSSPANRWKIDDWFNFGKSTLSPSIGEIETDNHGVLPGHSGGPLLNLNGEVSGITTGSVLTFSGFGKRIKELFFKLFKLKKPKDLNNRKENPLIEIYQYKTPALFEPITKALEMLDVLGVRPEKIREGNPSGIKD